MSSVDGQYRVVISDRAAQMLVHHVRFLAQASSMAADKLRRDVTAAAQSLQVFPERHPWLAAPLLPVRKYRKLLVDKRYLVIYQVKNETVYVDYVVDCRQDYTWLI
jgi:plasmid stabilization system protein ParE